MRIDFNEIASMTFPGMDNGTGMMSARMYNDDSYRITMIPTGSFRQRSTREEALAIISRIPAMI